MNEHLGSFSKLEFEKIRLHIRRYAVSEMGREHVEKLTPSSDLSEIALRQNLVTEMKLLLTADDPLPMSTVDDIRQSVRRACIENFVLAPEDLSSIATALSVTRGIKGYFARRKTMYPLLSERVEAIQLEKILEYNITQAIDEEGHVRDSASKELSGIRKQLSERAASLRKQLEKILKGVADNDWIQEEIITTRDGRMVIPIKSEHKNRVPGFIHSASASGATVFIEPTETLDLNNDLRTLQFREQREIERILRELSTQVAEASASILENVRIFSDLDFLHSKAQYSVEIVGASPLLTEDGPLSLINAYHPILLHSHARKEVVPLSVSMGDDARTLVITGPNAGGKSVAMKTVGVLTLLAQAGCHIPAAPESTIRIFSDLFIEMGDDQSIENDLSSFSSHLTNLKAILLSANATSLVLIDEIGSGTDPAEGASIAAAILEHLTHIHACTIVTTHHGVLKSFAYETTGMKNCAMEFDQATLTPTYRLRVGVPGSSYAIEMAERLRLPNQIVERAKSLRGTESMKLERLIEDLERRNQELSTNLLSVNEEKAKYNSMNLLYENKLSSLKDELKAVKSKALLEAQTIVDKANVAIEKAVREIKEQAASSAVVKTVRANVREIDRELQHMKEEFGASSSERRAFSVGDLVKLKDSDTAGEIVSQLDKEHYVLLAGDVRIKVKASELLPASRAGKTSRPGPSVDYIRQGRNEIDLRGMYGDEAIGAVEKFFDEAILSGLTRVNLIHGKGTGALRRKIDEYLKKNPSIKSFRLGEWNEGGSGVTVVELS